MDLLSTTAPALGLLLLLVLMAWGAKRFRQHLVPTGGEGPQSLRLLSTLHLGPQQRVMLVEITDHQAQVSYLLTLGVTPGAVTALHSTVKGQPGGAAAARAPELPAAFIDHLKQHG